MRIARSAAIAALLACASVPLIGQSGVADGLAALARGEHQRAVEILRPLAENDRGADPVAQFFMASMYEEGRGVPRDPLRACVLYHRAANFHEHPFGEEASHLMRALWQRQGNEFFADCQLISNLGFDHRFEPAIFELGPDHSIAWNLRGATVSYQGKTTNYPMTLASRGAAFLPLRYTSLPGDGASPRMRHFVEVFVWEGRDTTWGLAWHLYEVSGSELTSIAHESPLATSPMRPPAAARNDVRQLVTLRTNANGHAEWAILEGPHARSEGIPSAEERREVRELEAARKAADAKVDWNRRSDAQRLPSFAYSGNDGCANLFVYAWADDRSEWLSVRVDRETLQLSPGVRIIDIAQQPDAVALRVQVYQQPVRGQLFCTDVVPVPADTVMESWRAVGGRMTIELSAPGIRARNPALYRATIRIDNAEFVDSTGRRHRQTRPIVLTAVVGSFFG